ncbi:MAG: metallophosphoesterase [bacterium]
MLKNGNNIAYIKEELITHDLCMLAVTKSPSSLKYIPEKFKTREICDIAMKRKSSLAYIPSELYNFYYTYEVLSNYISKKNDSVASTSNLILENLYISNKLTKEFFYLFLTKEVLSITSKKYFDNKFIIEFVCDRKSYEISLDSFYDFIEYLNYDLSDADLLTYNFNNIDITKYDFTNSYLSEEILIKYKLYDDSFYESITCENDKLQTYEIVKQENFQITNTKFNIGEIKLYYISDLHLDHKIRNKFGEFGNKNNILRYVRKVAKDLFENVKLNDLTFAFILGDVSANFEISKEFYKVLSEVYYSQHIFIILGNHEYKTQPLEQTNKMYIELFNEISLNLLNNKFISIGKYKTHINTLEFFNTKTVEEVEKYFNEKALCIYGGTGFSGSNPNYNANIGLYNENVTREQEVLESEKFNEGHEFLLRHLTNYPVVIFSHMPKTDWCKEYVSNNFIYVSGHTHQNQRFKHNNSTFISDNQIGYNNDTFEMKFITMDHDIDLFRNYNDGIYSVSIDDYSKFLFLKRGQLYQSKVLKENVIMLKKKEIYMFFNINDKKQLKLLDGFAQRNISNQNIEYYYNNMDVISDLLKESSMDYRTLQEAVSSVLKQLNFSGRIHGCIVDIDFFNHIFIDPIEWDLRIYFAFDVSSRRYYSGFEKFLEVNYQGRLSEYLELKTKGISLERNDLCKNEDMLVKPTLDINMYKNSLIMNKIQSVTEMGILKIWDDSLIQNRRKCENIESIEEIEVSEKLLLE